MIRHLAPIFKRVMRLVRHPFRPPPPAPAPALPVLPPPPPDAPCPLIHPSAPLPAWVADDPLVQKYQALFGDLPWHAFPERPTDRPWPGPPPHPRAPFVAAYLIMLAEEKRYMSQLRTYLIEHPAVVYWLGFARVLDPSARTGFAVAATVPTRRQFSRVLRTLPNAALQFVLDASITVLRRALSPEAADAFGDTIAGDTQALLAWVRANNPKERALPGRFDPHHQPTGDPDCALGIKHRPRRGGADAADGPAPQRDATPRAHLQVGVDILWGYASGIVVTRIPDGPEVVLAERTRPFNESDASYFFPFMTQVEARLGRRPRFGAWDTAYDAHYVYEYFHTAGGWAAVPLNSGSRGSTRTFAPDGSPLCAAGLAMPRLFVYRDRTALVPHEREKCGCPLLHPQVTGAACPIDDRHFATGGCTTTLATSIGSRLRLQLDRESDSYTALFNQRAMVERINSQAEALHILRPKLRRGRAIVNRNTLIYILINLRALQRMRTAAAKEERETEASSGRLAASDATRVGAG